MKILVVAGEESADLHCSHLVDRLRRHTNVSLIGIGGDHLVRQGLKPVKHAREMAVVGLTEALKKVPQTLQLLAQLEQLAATEKPDCALLLDLPDVNLRLAPRLKRQGIKVIYYISPQVWAWRSGRVRHMTRCLDLLLLILPFEKAWYEKHAPAGLRTEYVGHPVLEEIPDLPFQPEAKVLALLPGSRENEWRSLLGPMLGAAAVLAKENPALEFRLPLAVSLRGNALVEELLSPEGPNREALVALGRRLKVEEVPAHDVLRHAKAAWIASGTATLEAGVVGVPMVVAYKVSATTAFLFRNFVRYTGPIAIVNLIHCGLGSAERLVPEVLQDEVEPSRLAAAMRALLEPAVWEKTAARLAVTRSLLSGKGLPLENAAQAILRFLKTEKEDRK
jgi:lipid-A-disaccharide synthase